jgi:hypothetical protein
VAVVIVIIPITIGMPAVAIFVPPAMPPVPAAFTRFPQVVPRMIGLPAVPTVMFDGFVEFVVRLGDAALAIPVVFRGRARRSAERQHASQYCAGEYGPDE